MSTDTGPRVGELLPRDAWNTLMTSDASVLIDVRTRAEWSFVGVPDLNAIGRQMILCEWAMFPDMSRNPSFVDTVIGEVGTPLPQTFLFICRSGARSLQAAHAVSARLAEMGHAADCINVAEGFEGDLNGEGHRGHQNGWKHQGLAWRQS